MDLTYTYPNLDRINKVKPGNLLCYVVSENGKASKDSFPVK